MEEVIVDRNNSVDIALAVPIEREPTTEDFVSVQTLAPSFDGLNRHGKLKCSWEVGLGPFKPGRILDSRVPCNSLPARWIKTKSALTEGGFQITCMRARGGSKIIL